MQLVNTFPVPRQVKLEDATSALARTSPPIVAGILPDEDFLRLWEINALPADARHRCEQQRQNFIEWYENRAVQFGLAPGDPIVLPRGKDRLTLPWSDVREWVSTVTLFTVGSTLVRNESAIFLAFIAVDGTMNLVPGPDYDGCSHDH